MTDTQLFDAIMGNRMLFTQWFIAGILMPLVVIYSAYMFRNFSIQIRGAALASALVGVVFLSFFSMTVQNIFFDLLSSMSTLAAAGESQMAKNIVASLNVEAGQAVTQPTWMMIAGTAQVLINLVLTVYLFIYAKWEK